jgi:methyltransferase (TIGR00027 family)
LLGAKVQEKLRWMRKIAAFGCVEDHAMLQPEPLIRNVSDTARWAAVYRARETDRPDAVFRDPLARRLAGARGDEIFNAMPSGTRTEWAWVTRTYLFDRLIAEQIAQGVDLVLNLAAGLDARPYRMELPAALRWVEVDLPELLAYKEEVLAGATPVCALERIPLDLSNLAGRRELFDKLGHGAKKALILTEGFLTYLSAEEVGALAEDLAKPAGFQRWVLELGSPGLLRMLQKQWNQKLVQAGSPLQFAPSEGPGFFAQHGWRPVEVHSVLKTGARLNRLSLWMRLLALLPESSGAQGKRPWSGICLLERG